MTSLLLRLRLRLTDRQVGYAARIVATIKADHGDTDAARRMADCALATGLVESNLTVYANGNNPESLRLPHDAVGWDHGSVGIYQQQVGGALNSTADWGTTVACMGVESSTRKFVAVLNQRDWSGKTNGQLCQSVQGSAFPDRYAARDTQAINIRKALWNAAPAKTAPRKPKPAKVKHGARVYTVQRGDTLYTIATAHGVSLSALELANRRAGHPAGTLSNIWPGDKLTLPR